jgi:hypothetical protein
MEPIRSEFKRLRNRLTPLVICIGKEIEDLTEFAEEGDDPPLPPYIVSPCLVVKKGKYTVRAIKSWFKPVREELELNLLMPINFQTKWEYLHEVINFYAELEGRIIEDSSGDFYTDFVVFEDDNFEAIPKERMTDYKDFLISFKYKLRYELTYVLNKATALMEEETIKDSNDNIDPENSQSNQGSLRWSKSDTDLLELIMSLYELGAIQNEDKNLTKEEAIQAFSNFFGKEIKDHYKKLNAARNRKKDDPDFLLKLQNALQVYYSNLDKKN